MRQTEEPPGDQVPAHLVRNSQSHGCRSPESGPLQPSQGPPRLSLGHIGGTIVIKSSCHAVVCSASALGRLSCRVAAVRRSKLRPVGSPQRGGWRGFRGGGTLGHHLHKGDEGVTLVNCVLGVFPTNRTGIKNINLAANTSYSKGKGEYVLR
jgi:hypothetical protein